jgi:hypothetical protein
MNKVSEQRLYFSFFFVRIFILRFQVFKPIHFNKFDLWIILQNSGSHLKPNSRTALLADIFYILVRSITLFVLFSWLFPCLIFFRLYQMTSRIQPCDGSFCYQSSACYLLHAGFLFLAWFIQPSRWRGHIPLKCQLTFHGLHGVIFQKIGLFITTAVRTSNSI